jgi:hypothetical protein
LAISPAKFTAETNLTQADAFGDAVAEAYGLMVCGARS